MRLLCKDRTRPDLALCRRFNAETQDGRNMADYSELLNAAIGSIIHVKDESDMDSFLKGAQMSFLSNVISGLEDFELICFLVVKERA